MQGPDRLVCFSMYCFIHQDICICMYMYVCMYVCMYIYINLYVQLYKYIYVYIYIYAHIYIYIHVFFHVTDISCLFQQVLSVFVSIM